MVIAGTPVLLKIVRVCILYAGGSLPVSLTQVSVNVRVTKVVENRSWYILQCGEPRLCLSSLGVCFIGRSLPVQPI